MGNTYNYETKGYASCPFGDHKHNNAEECKPCFEQWEKDVQKKFLDQAKTDAAAKVEDVKQELEEEKRQRDTALEKAKTSDQAKKDADVEVEELKKKLEEKEKREASLKLAKEENTKRRLDNEREQDANKKEIRLKELEEETKRKETEQSNIKNKNELDAKLAETKLKNEKEADTLRQSIHKEKIENDFKLAKKQIEAKKEVDLTRIQGVVGIEKERTEQLKLITETVRFLGIGPSNQHGIAIGALIEQLLPVRSSRAIELKPESTSDTASDSEDNLVLASNLE